jgi:hypothetical protein
MPCGESRQVLKRTLSKNIKVTIHPLQFLQTNIYFHSQFFDDKKKMKQTSNKKQKEAEWNLF